MSALSKVHPPQHDERAQKHHGEYHGSVNGQPSCEVCKRGGDDDGKVGEHLEGAMGMRRLP